MAEAEACGSCRRGYEAGASGNAGVNGSDSGHARIYTWNGTGWVQQGADIDGEAAGDYSGYSVALSADGGTAIIGAHYNDGTNDINPRHSRIYTWYGIDALV